MTDPVTDACDAVTATIARTLRDWPAPKPALPRMPADLLRECAAAAGLATCNPETETTP
jgi:hypothetical protein